MWLRVLLLMTLLSPALAAIDVYQFDTPAQEARFHKLTDELRCPKCQNQSIADSEADIAADMRDRVQKMILQGKSDQQIIQYFVDRYGNFVTYKPPVNARTAILWVGPGLVFLIGAVVIVLLIRRASRNVDDGEWQ
ncbi:MAG: cytochrome c-type biogenesis protein [Alcanivorax sp.]|nr:cytochrome c-type biogenesis protein [Alcanivorax sp.]